MPRRLRAHPRKNASRDCPKCKPAGAVSDPAAERPKGGRPPADSDGCGVPSRRRSVVCQGREDAGKVEGGGVGGQVVQYSPRDLFQSAACSSSEDCRSKSSDTLRARILFPSSTSRIALNVSSLGVWRLSPLSSSAAILLTGSVSTRFHPWKARGRSELRQ